MNPSTAIDNKRVIPSTGFEAPVTVNIAEDPVTVSAATIRKGHWVATANLHEEGNILLRSVKHSSNIPDVAKKNEVPTQTKSSDALPTAHHPSIKIAQDLPRPPSTSVFTSLKNMTKRDLKSAKDLMKNSAHPKHRKLFEEGGALTQVYFIDTGGQVEFHELLPPLLHGSAFHLIFFNAYLSLHKAVDVVYRHEDSAISSIKYETSSSSIEIIQQLLVSFYNISRIEGNQSVAALFGSYIDQLSSDPNERSKQLQAISDTLEAQFSNTSFYQQKFLARPLKDESPYIFQPLDNIKCSVDELKRAQKLIFDVVKERFSPVTLPVTWAMFHLALRNQYGQFPGVCTMQECIALADDCCISATHVPHVLEFFHSTLGTILYYNEISSLKDYIVVDPNIMFNGISRLVTLSFIGSGEHYGIAQSIRQTGEISAANLQLHKPLSIELPSNESARSRSACSL